MVLNIADMRLVHAREAQTQLKERFGEKVFDTVVRRSVRYAESAERGVSILDYAPGPGRRLPDAGGRVLERLGGFEEARERLGTLTPASGSRRSSSTASSSSSASLGRRIVRWPPATVDGPAIDHIEGGARLVRG